MDGPEASRLKLSMERVEPIEVHPHNTKSSEAIEFEDNYESHANWKKIVFLCIWSFTFKFDQAFDFRTRLLW